MASESDRTSSAAKEWLLWLVGWLMYPLISAAGAIGTASPEYRQAQVALKSWLHAKPCRELRLGAHKATAPERRPPEGW